MKSFFAFLKRDFLLAIIVFFLAFFLYIRTLAPSLLTGDVAEFQTLSYTMGMTHPSGYPIYIFLGRLFTLIPVENIAYRVNLMSAFFGALAVGQVFAILRLLDVDKWASLAGSLALALSPLFWQSTIFAEVYAPAAGMITSIWLFMLLWRDYGRLYFLFIAGLLGGLSIGIHSTVIMTSVSVLIYMLFYARQFKIWLVAVAGALSGVLLAFLAFLYLDANNPPSSIYNTVFLPNLSAYPLTFDAFDTPIERLLAILPAQSFWTYYFSAPADVILIRLQEYLLYYSFWKLVFIALGIFSLFILKKGETSLIPDALYILTAFLILWGFAITVEFSNYRDYYVPAALFIHVWLGAGIGFFLKLLGMLRNKIQENSIFSMTQLFSFVGIAFIGLILFQSRIDINLAVREGYTTFIRDENIYPYFKPDRYVRLATKTLRKVKDDAIVFAAWDRLYTYVYTAHILEGRTQISFHEVWPNISQTTLDYIDEELGFRPIYFTTLHPVIEKKYELEKIGDNLYRIRRKK